MGHSSFLLVHEHHEQYQLPKARVTRVLFQGMSWNSPPRQPQSWTGSSLVMFPMLRIEGVVLVVGAAGLV